MVTIEDGWLFNDPHGRARRKRIDRELRALGVPSQMRCDIYRCLVKFDRRRAMRLVLAFMMDRLR